MDSEGFQHCQGKLEHHQTDLSNLVNQDISMPKLLLKEKKSVKRKCNGMEYTESKWAFT